MPVLIHYLLWQIVHYPSGDQPLPRAQPSHPGAGRLSSLGPRPRRVSVTGCMEEHRKTALYQASGSSGKIPSRVPATAFPQHAGLCPQTPLP